MFTSGGDNLRNRPATIQRDEDVAQRIAGGVGVTVRANRGQDAGAACGQLAADRAGEPQAPVVARRREAIVRQSEAALRGSRSAESLPADLEAAVVGRAR